MQLLTTYRRAARQLGLFVTFSVRAAIQLLRPPCAIRNRRRHSGCLPGAKHRRRIRGAKHRRCNPEASRLAIDAEGWLRTADLGAMDALG